MRQISIIKSSEIELRRIDPEFYQPHFLKVRKRAGERKLKHYGVAVIHPAEFTRTYSRKGLRILLAQNNRANHYDWSTERYVVESKRSSIERNKLYYGDVTLTRSGANYGQASCILNEVEEDEIFACADLLIVRSSDISAALLSTYFNSSTGRFLLDRGAYGAGQPHIAPSYVREIPFPEQLLSIQDEIDSVILKSKTLSRESKSLYQQAQQILERELGLDKLTFEKPIGYRASFSEIGTSRRLDAGHYQFRFRQLLKHLEKYPTEKVLHIQRYNRRGVQPSYVDGGERLVVNSQHIGATHLNYEGLQRTSGRSYLASPEAHIRENDLLIYTTGAYVGQTNVYLSSKPALASNHVGILRLKPGIDPAYMALVFQSVIGKFQTEKHARGSAQAELYPNDLAKFVVPILDEATQRSIGDLLRGSLAKSQQSKQLLEQAKTRVEQLIEEAIAS